ncbi:MAG: PIN domain-containing protein [archaeon]
MTKLYVDSNVWIDLWADRMIGLIPVGHYAENMVERALACEFNLVVSDFILKEVEHNLNINAEERLIPLKQAGKLQVEKVDSRTFAEAKTMSFERNIPIHDAMHALMARKVGALLITRDKHFQELTDIVKTLEPSEL